MRGKGKADSLKSNGREGKREFMVGCVDGGRGEGGWKNY